MKIYETNSKYFGNNNFIKNGETVVKAVSVNELEQKIITLGSQGKCLIDLLTELRKTM